MIGTGFNMCKIIEFRLKQRPSREHALQWLSQHIEKFPNMDVFMDDSLPVFHLWMFMRVNGIVYFADCCHKGITQDDLDDFRKLEETYNDFHYGDGGSAH